MLKGVKTRYNAIGLDVKSNIHEFNTETYDESKLDSFMVWAQAEGKDTGKFHN